MLTVERLTRIPDAFFSPDRSQRSGLLAEWHALSGDRTVLDADWLLGWWLHFGEAATVDRGRRELCLLAIRDAAGQLVGVAPFYIDRSFSAGGVLRYLGSGIVCTDYLTILAREEGQRQIVEAVAQWLLDEGCAEWERIELVGTDDSNAAIPYLMELLAADGNRLHTRAGDNTWRLELPPTWDDYLATMSGRRRNRVRKIIKTEFDTGLSQLRETKTAEEFEMNWPIFERLHQARRESVGDGGVFSCPDFAAFLRDVAKRLFAKGELDLLLLDRAGKPINVEFNPCSGGTIFSYQGGMDPHELQHQPGHLMTLARVRRGIEQGKSALDFMRGDERHKAEWGGQKRTTTEYRLVKRKPIASLRHGIWLAGQQARRMAKSGVTTAHQVLRKDGQPR